MPGCLPVGGYCAFFFFNDTATTEIYTLSLHDALPISGRGTVSVAALDAPGVLHLAGELRRDQRSEEHPSELQSRRDLVCRLLLEKKKKKAIFTLIVIKKKKVKTRIHIKKHE